MLSISATANTPKIEFDTDAGVLTISGKSIAENSHEFYKPLFAELAEYKKKPCFQTMVHFKLVYFNTSASKSILDLLRQLELLKAESDVTINWYYEKEDEDMLEVGEDYLDIVNLNFKMIEVENF